LRFSIILTYVTALTLITPLKKTPKPTLICYRQQTKCRSVYVSTAPLMPWLNGFINAI